jgi:hypothetical protein
MRLSRLAVILAVVPVLAVAGGCCESQKVQLNPVWSATVPAQGATWTKTTNVFPLYSKNETAFTDRYEETTNVLLFVSWSKVTPRATAIPDGRVQVTNCAVESTGSCVQDPQTVEANAPIAK